jgi:cytochrome c peroxidase
MKIASAFAVALATLAVVALASVVREVPQPMPAEVRDLWLANLEPLPADPSNRWADDAAAAELGHRLFFDTRLSSDGSVACATCHDPGKEFQDGRPLARGVGTTDRRTMPIAGTAYSPFLFWDGRKDSQWAQALGPLESPVEHGGTRALYARVIATHYRADYERVFGAMPDTEGRDPDGVTRVFVNIGKAIAAYERRIGYGASPFDTYVAAWEKNGAPPRGVLTAAETAGMALFTGKAGCIQCHNGPLLTNNEFHNTGVPQRTGVPADRGRIVAAATVKSDEFNCRSRWSDAAPGQCPELDVLPAPSHAMDRAFKVPSLRNVADRAPYMHAGQFQTLAEVLQHYNTAPAAPAGHSELKPLRLTPEELRQLEAFLRSLSGGVAASPLFLAEPARRR